MKNKYYLLINHKPHRVGLKEWAKWMETADRSVALTKKNDIIVSTVFWGQAHDFSGKGKPLLFETMVFGGKHDTEQARYSTWEEAEEGHQAMVRRV